VTVSHREKGSKISLQTGGFAISYPEEYRALQENRSLLERVAETGGGHLLKKPEEVFGGRRRSVPNTLDVWSWLVLLAFLLFPFDVAIRRVMMDWEAGGETVAALKKRLLTRISRRRARELASEGTTSRLLSRKQRIRARQESAAQPIQHIPRPASPEPLKPPAVANPSPEEPASPESQPSKAPAGSHTRRLLEKKRRLRGE